MPNVENHVDEGGDKSEVVVTEAMIEAGARTLSQLYFSHGFEEDFEVLAEKVLRASLAHLPLSVRHN